MQLSIDDRFNQQLPADPATTKETRQVDSSAFSWVTPRIPSQPQLLHVAREVAELVGLTEADIATPEFLQVFSGAKLPAAMKPYAMCYGGHQFGSWAGQLGDGRAINLAEVAHSGQHWMLQLKGAGLTPYSRMADGLAVLRSSLREHLCSEAMFHLGVPTTRSLCLLLTGDRVLRDVMYDGHPEYEPGAIICRVAPSFIRFGSYEIFAVRQDLETLRQLTDHTIQHHFPELETGTQNGYGEFFRMVCQRTRDMIIHWHRVGFVHGVMNTDNMSIHGITIDYGPYGWLEGYEPAWTPNTTDRQRRRYRFGSQPQVALWNLLQLANALYPLVQESEPFERALKEYQDTFPVLHERMLASKIGLDAELPGDQMLLAELDAALQLTETDMTIFYRRLADLSKATEIGSDDGFLAPVADAFYAPDQLVGDVLNQWRGWFQQYVWRLRQSAWTDEERRKHMQQINPKYVFRNYMAQLAIDKVETGDISLLEELFALLKNPYAEQPAQEKWFVKRPEWARHKVGCSMLSCSS